MIAAFAWPAAPMNTLLRLNFQAALLAVFVTIVCILCRRRLTAHWKSMLWMLVFLRLCLPVGPQFVFSLTNLIPGAGIAQSAVTQVSDPASPPEPLPVVSQPGSVSATGSTTLETVAHTSPAMPHRSIRDVLILAWLGGAMVLLSRLCWLRVLLSRQLSGLSVVSDSAIIRLAGTCAHDAGLARPPRLLWGPDGTGPAVLGWRRPILLLPRNSATMQEQRLRAILMHEFHHVTSGDTLLAWLPRVLCALFWFNPPLWWAGRKWLEEREMACDAWVLRQIGPEGKQGYLETLVAVATDSQQATSLVFTATIVSSATLLERRILAMKRYRNSGWKGVAAGILAVLIAASVGLTDSIRAAGDEAPDKAVRNAASDNPIPAAADVGGKDAPAPAPPGVLHPTIVFARHVILWEGTEVVTAEQLKQRLADLRARQPVKPNLHFSLGFNWKNMQEAQNEKDRNDALNRGVLDATELAGGQSECYMLSMLARRGSAVFDRIETADDLTPGRDAKLTGRVLLPGGASLAVGAQVVILPVEEPCSLYLNNGRLRDVLDEICYTTDDQGVFEAYPGSLKFDPVLFFGKGTYNAVILHEQGYLVINGQLAREKASYELLPWQMVTITTPAWAEGVSAEICITPDGAGTGVPCFSVAWPGANARIQVKAPLGTGSATYVVSSSDGGHATDFSQPITITTDSPAEIALPDLPADRQP